MAVRRVPVIPTDVRVGRAFVVPSTSCAPPLPDPQSPVNRVPLLVAGVLAVAATAVVWSSHGARFGTYLGLGLLLGVSLFHSRFGFASGWLRLVSVGNGAGLRAQALMLGTAATVIAPIASGGLGLFGATPVARAGDIGVPLVVGAALFGVGMQLAGSCASGTLFAVGAGQTSILPALAGFVAGSVLGTGFQPVVDRLPGVGGVLLADHVGWFGSWAVTVGVLLAVVVATAVVQNRRVPPPEEPVPTARGFARLYRGSWSLPAGALVVGALAGLVFLASGAVWGVTSGYSLWGAKVLQGVGLHPEQWQFWRDQPNAAALAGPLLRDRTSLTNFGIMIGAAVASAAAGGWRLGGAVPWRVVVASLLGGLLMGVGARMSGGCTIGALLGGISTGSLHGWLWAACALGGTYLGLRLRPAFGLTNPKPDHGTC
ncbi:YeeE/YedE family protein [Saccharothrix obliqua]|uniref:YeeE/YedE family protein n=1 Tax=Saccharothrix obliqua TaxID=2861747 RepID=UPI001C5EFB54|nr:YeeE/YedE family protein [Saccharothrix obliqua]MBW4718096.1 YeeE/YedE family protein [Saccharothrix obliqua]